MISMILHVAWLIQRPHPYALGIMPGKDMMPWGGWSQAGALATYMFICGTTLDPLFSVPARMSARPGKPDGWV